MRRPTVISLCIMNACIAAGLLWFINGNKPQQQVIMKLPRTEPLSDDALWERSMTASSFREALFQLSQIQDQETLMPRVTQEIEKLLTMDQPPLDRWPFFQSVLQKYGGIASNKEELALLARFTSNNDQPLTLRDTAFRSYVENSRRLQSEGDYDESPFVLIDAMYQENSSLSETALQAEHFLAKNSVRFPDQRRLLFEARLKAALGDEQRTESVRIAALNILNEKGLVSDLPLDELYPDAGVRLQTAILHTLTSANIPDETKHWLKGIQATTPEQEQVLLRMQEH